MVKTTELKSVFIDKDIKKVIEIYMSMNGFSQRSDALFDFLKDNPKFMDLYKWVKKQDKKIEKEAKLQDNQLIEEIKEVFNLEDKKEEKEENGEMSEL